MKKKNRKIKIVLCANTSWYIYNFRKNTIIALIDHGCDVIVVAPYDDYVEDLIKLGARHFSFYLNGRSINLFKELFSLLNLVFIYIYLRPHAVMNFTPKMNIYGTFASSIVRSKAINNISGLGAAFTKKSLFSDFIIMLYKASQLFATKVFFQNMHDKKLFINNKILTEDRCDLIPGSGVDLNLFYSKPSSDDGVVRFLIVCRMLYEKGILSFVEASDFLRKKYGKKVEFQALGFLDDTNNAAVSHKVMNEWVSKGLISYLGATKDVRPYLANSDCVVLPSIYPEGVPRSLLEAAAMGKPIVTTNTAGCSFTVDNGENGFLCHPGSTKDLINKLEKIINLGHEGRTQMGNKSRVKAENEFSEQIVIDKYIQSLGLIK